MIGIFKALFYMFFVLVVAQLVNFLYGFLIFYIKKRRNLNTENNSDISVKMLQCDKCKIYIAKNEAYIVDGKTYCSKDHSI